MESVVHGCGRLSLGTLLVGIALTGRLAAADRYVAPPPGASGAGSGSDIFSGGSGTATGADGSSSRGLLDMSPPASPPPAGTTAPAGNSGNFNLSNGSGPMGTQRTSPPPAVDAGQPRPITPIVESSQPIGGGLSGSRPAAAAYETSPLGPPPSTAPPAAPNANTPSGLMRAMMNPLAGTQLRGQKLTLLEVISGARSRPEQTQRVEAYWDLCSSVADYYLGLLEQEELGRVIQRGAPGWDRIGTDIQNRTATSLRGATAAQMRLASLMNRGDGFYPLPTDPPHCATYISHFEQIFSRGAPPEARVLNELLPLRYAELKDAADEVRSSEQRLYALAGRVGTGDEGGVALGLLALQRRAFVQIARDYNRRIARYAELASPGQVTPERLTGMLIKLPVSTATKPANPAPALDRRSSTTSPPPPTYAEGPSTALTAASNSTVFDSNVQPASAARPTSDDPDGSREERSLLVSPAP